jgi:CRP-like cAMP-binding protein
MAVQIQGIEIFSEVEEGKLGQIEALFITRSFEKGDEVTRFGEPVDGLYLLDKGEVEVSIPGFEGILATLKEGSSFGELSLFNPEDVASATVAVSSDTAELLFCPRDALNLALSVDEKLAASFYRGSTIMVTERLKNTNRKISGEISKSINTATRLIEEVSTAGDLGQTQDELLNVGSSIVSSMTDIVKSLLVLKESNRAVDPVEIARLADKAKDIYYSDFHVFEKVSKQLKVIGQHLDNVNLILSHQPVLEVEEDMSLDDLS